MRYYRAESCAIRVESRDHSRACSLLRGGPHRLTVVASLPHRCSASLLIVHPTHRAWPYHLLFCVGIRGHVFIGLWRPLPGPGSCSEKKPARK